MRWWQAGVMPHDLPTRADYVAWRTATTRWRDDDAYGQLNNVTYYELFDTAVNTHLFEAPAPMFGVPPLYGMSGRRAGSSGA